MIERELADLLQTLEAAHLEATKNDSFWTPSAVAFHWRFQRFRVGQYSPEQQAAYKRDLEIRIAEAGRRPVGLRNGWQNAVAHLPARKPDQLLN